ncbi:hypothetical protein [Vibrio vulnificus]|uniref:hypothetical protein n=1 Tax=Vibrio vulnificus TaxID=672 RepID=UPI003241CB76
MTLCGVRGKPHIVGVYDCNLIALQFIGFDISKIEPFDTVRGGLVAIRKATGCKTWAEVMNKHNYELINPMLIEDGCVLSKGIHRFIFKDGYLFGVHPISKKFDFFKINYNELHLFEVYKRWV